MRCGPGLFVLLLTTLLAGACAGHRSLRIDQLPEAGTGDLAFRLVWQGQSDLDLHVVDPAGARYWYVEPLGSGATGRLDVDCNRTSDALCERPVENVYWAQGTAPEGVYQAWAVAHSVLPAEAPLAAQLLVLAGREVRFEESATFSERGGVLGPLEVHLDARGRITDIGPASFESRRRDYRCADGFEFAPLHTPQGFDLEVADQTASAYLSRSPTGMVLSTDFAHAMLGEGPATVFVDGVGHSDCQVQ